MMRSACWALRVLLVVGFSIASNSVLGQERFPWAKLISLSERKGEDVTQGGPCQHLGLSANCKAYQVAYQDDEWMHAFNVMRLGSTRTGHLILFRRNDTGAGRFYLTDLKGKLLKAISRREGAGGAQSSWSELKIDSPEVRRGFAEELTYWRGKQADLEAEADRQN
jgi:hypothetical protein